MAAGNNRGIVTTRDVTCTSVNGETKKQAKQWMHTHSPDKTKKSKQTSACQKADGSWDMKGVLMVEFMQQ
jgi:hypothetical protein